MAKTTIFIGDLHKQLDARDARIAELEAWKHEASKAMGSDVWLPEELAKMHEQLDAAGLAAWDAEWRAQRKSALLERAEWVIHAAIGTANVTHTNCCCLDDWREVLVAIRAAKEESK